MGDARQGGESFSPNPRILLIADTKRVFWDGHGLVERGIRVCPDVAEGVQEAIDGDFDVIALELHGVSHRLGALLKTLKEHTHAKIFLMVRICEEPIARRFVGLPGQGLVESYLICPTSVASLSSVSGDGLTGRRLEEAVVPQPDALTVRVRHLEKLATEDDLTGLKNRRYIWEFSRQILELAKREHTRVTLLVYDIDDFKQYNDTYGHAMGDRILKETAVLMRRCCRSHDVVGRIGGDEFAVIFWDEPSPRSSDIPAERRSPSGYHPREAVFIAQRFRTALQRYELPLLGPRASGVLTISGALATFPEDGGSIDQLFQKADAALLDAKRSGKNRICLVGTPPNGVVPIE